MIRRFSNLLFHARNAAACIFWTAVARVRLFFSGAQVGPGLVVSGPIFLRVHPTATLRIGRNCRLNSGFGFNPVGGHRRLAIWLGPGATMTLRDGCGLSNCTLVAMCEVEIGEDVRVGGCVSVYDSDFHSLKADERLKQPDPSVRKAPIVIGARSFIGAHSILLKGSALGEEAVLGAGSVLTSKVPAREVWAGNPALFRKELV